MQICVLYCAMCDLHFGCWFVLLMCHNARQAVVMSHKKSDLEMFYVVMSTASAVCLIYSTRYHK